MAGCTLTEGRVAYCGCGVHGDDDILISLAGLSNDISDDLGVGVLHDAGILGADSDGAGVPPAAHDADDAAGAAVVHIGRSLYEDLHPLIGVTFPSV